MLQVNKESEQQKEKWKKTLTCKELSKLVI